MDGELQATGRGLTSHPESFGPHHIICHDSSHHRSRLYKHALKYDSCYLSGLIAASYSHIIPVPIWIQHLQSEVKYSRQPSTFTDHSLIDRSNISPAQLTVVRTVLFQTGDCRTQSPDQPEHWFPQNWFVLT